MPTSDSCSFFKKAGKKAGKVVGFTAFGTVAGGLGAVAAFVPMIPLLPVAMFFPFIAAGAVIGGGVGFTGSVCCPNSIDLLS